MTAQPPPEATRESDLTGLLELIRTEARPAAPATAQGGSTATVPSLTPQTAHTPQDNRCCIDRMSKTPGELEEYMAGSVRRDRAIQSEGERVHASG
jgi:hypothetical protein